MLIDYLTQHYYITSKVKKGQLITPELSLFAPAKVESHLIKLNEGLKVANSRFGRQNNPIRFSIDEWNNRHSVADTGNFKFTRNDPRRQFDAAIIASMLNVFIRQSPYVEMANYIFPVNGHGLIRTLGDTGAFVTPVYFIFEQYRKWMLGNKLNVEIKGPDKLLSYENLSVEGDPEDVESTTRELTFIDAAAIISQDEISIAVINRSHNSAQKVKLRLPKGYEFLEGWKLESENINEFNSSECRNNLWPSEIHSVINNTFTILPCGVWMVKFRKSQF